MKYTHGMLELLHRQNMALCGMLPLDVLRQRAMNANPIAPQQRMTTLKDAILIAFAEHQKLRNELGEEIYRAAIANV